MSGGALLVFARCAGFVFRAPGFSHPAVPPPVRACLALAFAMALVPASARSAHPDGAAFALAIALEFAVGSAIGIAASAIYDGAYAGGRALDDYVGIRGSVPAAQMYASAGFGRIWSLAFTAGYFLLGGYRVALQAFAYSFTALPPGGVPGKHGILQFAASYPAAVLESALVVAGPAIVLVFVAQTVLGTVARVVPRFSAFTLSFPVVLAAAIVATVFTVPAVFDRSALPWLHLPFLERR